MSKDISTIFEDGKPIKTSDFKEKERLGGRITIIDEVLKEMGYSEGYDKYQEYVAEMSRDFSDKYLPFLDRINQLSKERDL